MSENRLLTSSMLARELNVGQATLKFWLNRFNRWLPYTMEKGQKLYHPDLIERLVLISEHFGSGMLPSEIETLLDGDDIIALEDTRAEAGPHEADTPDSKQTDARIPDQLGQKEAHHDGHRPSDASLVSDLITALSSHQERIAIAQERTAAAEEKKSEALLKRAEAEVLKAKALDHLAEAIHRATVDFSSGKQPPPFPPSPEASPPSDEIPADSDIPTESNSLSDIDPFETPDLPENLDAFPSPDSQPVDFSDSNDDLGLLDEPDADTPYSEPTDFDPDEDEANPILQGLEDLSHLIDEDTNDEEAPDEDIDLDMDIDFEDDDDDDIYAEMEEIAAHPDDTFKQNEADDASSFSPEKSDIPDFYDEEPISPIDLQDSDLDDLSALIEDEPPEGLEALEGNGDEMDDLSTLIADDLDTFPAILPDLPADSGDMDEMDNLEALISDDVEKPDDLAALLEDDGGIGPASDHESDLESDFNDMKEPPLDDLSALIENPVPGDFDSDMNDLSALIDDPTSLAPDSDMDDLSSLIEDLGKAASHPESDSDMDDLSALIGEDAPDAGKNGNKGIFNEEMDDLSALIDGDPAVSATPEPSNGADFDDMDDLSALISNDDTDPVHKNNTAKKNETTSPEPEPESPPPTPMIKKPTASFETEFEKFKSEVINIIIKLKKDGYIIEETTELLNKEGITTLSGKNRWSTKMISKIYSFIEAAEK